MSTSPDIMRRPGKRSAPGARCTDRCRAVPDAASGLVRATRRPGHGYGVLV